MAEYIEVDAALAMLPEGDRIHTFVNPGGILVGADWDRADVVALIQSGKPELTGNTATRVGHGIAVLDRGRYVFIETREIEQTERAK
jgi:hypothetical protein